MLIIQYYNIDIKIIKEVGYYRSLAFYSAAKDGPRFNRIAFQRWQLSKTLRHKCDDWISICNRKSAKEKDARICMLNAFL